MVWLAGMSGNLVTVACFMALAVGALCASARTDSSRKSARFTVIPPGPVTDKIRVEMRVAIPNESLDERSYEVAFYCDKVTSNQPLGRVFVMSSPGGFALARMWWNTAGHSGRHKLIARVRPSPLEPGSRPPTQALTWPLEVVASTTRALPLLQGGWLEPLGLSNSVYARDRDMEEQDLRDLLDAMKRLRMSVLLVPYVEYQGYWFYPSGIRFHDGDAGERVESQYFDFDVVETVLSQAEKHDMHVFLGLGRSGDVDLLWEFDKADWKERNQHAVDIATSIAKELWERYGHYRSFYGWYLTHEMNDLKRSSAYYDPVADFCHSLSPDKPVLVAPAGTPIINKESLAASHVDIFCYQDAVGAGYVPYQYTYIPESRIAILDEVFRGYRRLHEGTDKHLWGDLEIWEMDGSKGYG
ncbi:MAG: DUF4434 domain-containing protein, partial [Armatimonadetes bacterium]|nr:DUF4434 domain-containing protein [Armatimonadota bacterium]